MSRGPAAKKRLRSHCLEGCGPQVNYENRGHRTRLQWRLGRRVDGSSPRPEGSGARPPGTPTSSSAVLEWPQATPLKPPTRSPQSASSGPVPTGCGARASHTQTNASFDPARSFPRFLVEKQNCFYIHVFLIICHSDESVLSDTRASRSCTNHTTSFSRLVSVIRKPRRDF